MSRSTDIVPVAIFYRYIETWTQAAPRSFFLASPKPRYRLGCPNVQMPVSIGPVPLVSAKSARSGVQLNRMNATRARASRNDRKTEHVIVPRKRPAITFSIEPIRRMLSYILKFAYIAVRRMFLF